MCYPTRIRLLEIALRRALLPNSFDHRGFLLPGHLDLVLDAERDALRSANAILGPTEHTFPQEKE